MITFFHGISYAVYYLFKNKMEEQNIRDECIPEEFNITFDPPVFRQRYGKVYDILIHEKWRKHIRKCADFGCSEFGLFIYMKTVSTLREMIFVDIDENLLREYISRIKPLTVDYINRRTQPLSLNVYAGSVGDPDSRLRNVDLVSAIELIEHLYPDTLDALPYNIFSYIRPKIAIITTPNADFNVVFGDSKKLRHYDHKFEWTRDQFEDWCNNLIQRFPDYCVEFSGIGEGPDGTELLGCCSQMAVFYRKDVFEGEIDYSDIDYLECEPLPPTFPTASCGICTYQTCSKKVESFDTREFSYKHIETIQYPFEYDHRTEDEKLISEFKYRINVFGTTESRFYNEDTHQCEIPLKALMYGDVGSQITEVGLKRLLEKVGYTIIECGISDTDESESCVVYEPPMRHLSISEGSYGSDINLDDLQDVVEDLEDDYEEEIW